MAQRNVLAGIVLVSILAIGGVVTGGLLFTDVFTGDDTDISDGADDPTGAESVDNGSETTDGGDESTDGSDANQETEESSAENESDDPGEVSETASMPVSIEAADRGPVEQGEMRLFNTTTGELTATHNFSDGHEHTFENLTPETTYDLVVNVSYYPDETITFNPRVSEEIDETIGYEFRGADSYVIEWEVEEIFQKTKSNNETDKSTITYRGTSKLGVNGDFFISWTTRGYGDSYDHLWLNDRKQAYLDYPSRGTDWQKSDRNYTERPLPRESVVEQGISSNQDRQYIEKRSKISQKYDFNHIYEIVDDSTGDPIEVHIDPDTGYVTYIRLMTSEIESSDTVRSIAEYKKHNENVSVIPDNFPLDEFY